MLFLVVGGLEHHFQEKPSDSLRRTYCDRSLSPRGQADSRELQKSASTRLWKLRG